MTRRRRTDDALEILDGLVGDDKALGAWIDEDVQNAELAHLIRTARLSAGLTQRDLADRIGSSQPAVARVEDAEYEGHSFALLRRIASALGLRIEVRLRPLEGRRDR